MSDYLLSRMKFNLQDVRDKAFRKLKKAVERRSIMDGASCYIQDGMLIVEAPHARYGIVADAAEVANSRGIDWVAISPQRVYDNPLSISGRIGGQDYQVDYASMQELCDAWQNFSFPSHGRKGKRKREAHGT